MSMEQLRDVPGTRAGKTETYWLAPFVKVSTDTVGRTRSSVVTWYAQGDEVKTLPVNGAQPGYVSTRENGENVILGVNEDWRVVLPKKTNPNDVMATAHTACSANSHVLLDEFSRIANR